MVFGFKRLRLNSRLVNDTVCSPIQLYSVGHYGSNTKDVRERDA
jgi:hypothetical protein